MSEPSGCASRTSNFLPDEQSCDSATLDTIAKLLTDGLSDTGDPAAACSEEDMRSRLQDICESSPIASELVRGSARSTDAPEKESYRSLLVQILEVFGYNDKKDGGLGTFVMRTLWATQVQTLLDAASRVAEVIHASVKQTIRVIQLTTKLGAVVTDTEGSVGYSLSQSLTGGLNSVATFLTNPNGFVVKGIAVVGLVRYLSNMCEGHGSVDVWTKCFVEATDWIAGLVAKILPTQSMGKFLNFLLSNHIYRIRSVFSGLDYHLSRFSSYCALAPAEKKESDAPAEKQESDGQLHARLRARYSVPTNS